MKILLPMRRQFLFLFVVILGLLLLAQVTVAQTQTGAVRGVVKDSTGGVIPGANIALESVDGHSRTSATDASGAYSFSNVPPGQYTLKATYEGLQQPSLVAITVATGRTSMANIGMTVKAPNAGSDCRGRKHDKVSTDPANNLSALVLKKEDLDALPDDPDDLTSDLEALAEIFLPLGPGGTQIFVDGFTGGRLPPKASIREIRINSNPFSAEYDKMGFGRIEIFTKPGSDKFHGSELLRHQRGIVEFAQSPFNHFAAFPDTTLRRQCQAAAGKQGQLLH